MEKVKNCRCGNKAFWKTISLRNGKIIFNCEKHQPPLNDKNYEITKLFKEKSQNLIYNK